jgi:hypothetical protein
MTTPDSITLPLAYWYGWHHVPYILQSSVGWLKFMRSELSGATNADLASLKRSAYEAMDALIRQREISA